MPKKRLTDDKRNQALYDEAVQEAKDYGVNLSYFEPWFIELNPSNRMSIKYKAILLFALMGFYKANDLVLMFNYKSEKAFNEDFNKKIGSLVRTNLGFQDGVVRLGLTSIRPACRKHKPELFRVYNDHGSVNVLSQRYTENNQLEESCISNKTSADEVSKN